MYEGIETPIIFLKSFNIQDVTDIQIKYKKKIYRKKKNISDWNMILDIEGITFHQ